MGTILLCPVKLVKCLVHIVVAHIHGRENKIITIIIIIVIYNECISTRKGVQGAGRMFNAREGCSWRTGPHMMGGGLPACPSMAAGLEEGIFFLFVL